MQPSFRPLGLAAAILTLCASAAHAQSLTTLFATNNNGNVGGANYFDLTVTGVVKITSFDQNCIAAASTPVGIKVYTAPMTSVGNETNAAAWTLVSEGSGIAAGTNMPTAMDTADFFLLPGSHGIAIVGVNTALAYTNGTGSNQNYMNAELSIVTGTATNVPFTAPIFNPRVWNGTIHYVSGGSNIATYGSYGTGCMGTNNRIPRLLAAPMSLPKINTTFTINLSDMPTASPGGLVTLGTSKTMWLTIPLPFDLSNVGMPNCQLLTGILTLQFVVNASGTGSWTIGIPNATELLGGGFFNQALVLDQGANAANLTASNGGEGTIGR